MNEFEILKAAKKQPKRGLSVREFNYWALEDLVHSNLLHKSYPKHGRGAGWPCYKLSRKGARVLKVIIERGLVR